MQMYILAPALILALYKKPDMGIIITTSLLVLSCACSLGPLHTIAETMGCESDYFWTPARMGSYVMGILLAYLLFRTNSQVPNTRATKVLMLVGWAIAASLVRLLVLTPGGIRAFISNPDGPAWQRMPIERLLFSATICWIIFAGCVGYGGIISEFLSWNIWLPLSRLSYVAYLIHPLVLYAFYGHYMQMGPLFYSGFTWFILFAGLSVWIFLGAIVVSVGVEVPFSELGRHVLPRRRGRKPENGKAPRPTGAEKPQNGVLPLKGHGQ
ncbi:O-acyltransferase like protein-like [Branchiostoma floridae x Branchiostoma japonicum]